MTQDYRTMKCKHHPKYKAIRAPKANCNACRAIWRAKKDNEKQKWQRTIQCLAKAESLLPSYLDKELYGGYIRDNQLESAWDELYMLYSMANISVPEFDCLMEEAGNLLKLLPAADNEKKEK